jgi:hypothetical protein
MNDPICESDGKRLSIMPTDEKRSPGGARDSAWSLRPVKSASKPTIGKFDSDPAPRFRWILWMLAVLVIVCLVLAGWVWFQILHIIT